MKISKYIIAASALALTIAVTGCSDEREALGGEGRVMLSANINSDVRVVSRAATGQELAGSALIWISNSKGPVRKYKGFDQIPADGVWLAAGSYTAEAWAGDSVPASFDKRYYKGRETFDIASGSTARVDITCYVANVVSSVNYDAEVDDVLTDYTMTVAHDRGTLTFEGRDERKGYFMMPSTDTDLRWTLEGTDNTGRPFSRSGVIADVQPRHEYVLNVRMTGSADEIGGGWLTIEVDDRTNDIVDNITISVAPDIKGYNFDINQGINGEQGTIGRRSVWVLASSRLKRVEMQCAYLATLLGDPAEVDCDFRNMTDSYRANLAAKGINATYDEDAVSGSSRTKINFESEFTNSLPNGNYDITIIAEDETGKVSSQTMTISISDAPLKVSAPDLSPAVLHATYTTVSAVVLRDDVTGAAIEYRRQGTPAWTRAESTVSGDIITAELTGLTPGTTYEYRAVCDGFDGTAPQTFTTESAPQIPNGGFEDWCMDGKVQRLAASASDLFWDSGNQGSATIGTNITTPESVIKHSGSYAAKLKSQNVVIKFAAGNCFVGKFIGLQGMSDGILGWGREFKGRPKALRGRIKYEPVAITHVGSNAPAGVSKGQMDRGIIYVALTTSTTCDDSEYGSQWPVIIRTNKNSLRVFDKNDAGIMAYGEQIWTEATPGDGLIEFTIPLDYRRTDVLPERLIITCSASQYGDYFTGGDGSTMYIDDFEFIY